MKKTKSIFDRVFSVIDIYFPVAAFVVLFVFYFILILLRYFFGRSIGWMYETMYIVFAWSTVMSAAYGSRKNDTISFNVVYDHLSDKMKCVFNIIADGILVGLFVYSMPALMRGIKAQAMTKTATLKISNSIVFFPYVIFVVLMIIYHLRDLIRSVKLLTHPITEETENDADEEKGGVN